MDNKKINAFSTINRALGIIEGVAWVIDNPKAESAIGSAVEMIDTALEDLE